MARTWVHGGVGFINMNKYSGFVFPTRLNEIVSLHYGRQTKGGCGPSLPFTANSVQQAMNAVLSRRLRDKVVQVKCMYASIIDRSSGTAQEMDTGDQIRLGSLSKLDWTSFTAVVGLRYQA